MMRKWAQTVTMLCYKFHPQSSGVIRWRWKTANKFLPRALLWFLSWLHSELQTDHNSWPSDSELWVPERKGCPPRLWIWARGNLSHFLIHCQCGRFSFAQFPLPQRIDDHYLISLLPPTKPHSINRTTAYLKISSAWFLLFCSMLVSLILYLYYITLFFIYTPTLLIAV